MRQVHTGIERKNILMISMVAVMLSAVLFASIGCEDADPVDPLADVFAVLQDTILTSRTLVSDSTYVLSGDVILRTLPTDTSTTTLTINPGTVILGEHDTNGRLIVEPGAKLIAQGTESSPIIFTSDRLVGQRAAGDWGGVILQGSAPVNNSSLLYGGTVSDDSSGILNYVRIEFAGNNANGAGLLLQGVGGATVLDYVQVHRSGNAGIKIDGGEANLLHTVVTQPGSNGISWDNGWTGEGQYWVVQSTASAAGVRGSNNPDSPTSTPISNPLLYNVSLVEVESASNSIGVIFTNGTLGTIRNSVVLGFETALEISGTESNAAAEDTTLKITHSMFYDNTSLGETANTTSETIAEAEWIADSKYVNRFRSPQLLNPYDLDDPEFYAVYGSPAYIGDSLASAPLETSTGTVIEDFRVAGAERYYLPWVRAWTTFDRN